MKESTKRAASPHKAIIDKRAGISISGVLALNSYDEKTVCAETEEGYITIKGDNLHVSALNLNNGTLEITGIINSLNYDSQPLAKLSFLSKIFK